MPNLVNPRWKLDIYGESEVSIDSDSLLHMTFDIEKDLEEEANLCELTIYNLNESTRDKITNAENQEAPLELFLSPSGSSRLVLAFRGNIDSARSVATNPGHETVIRALSQQMNHRAFHVNKEFAAGTPKDEIINYFIDKIGLAKEVESLPTDRTILSESFDGPAFVLLRQYCFDLGLYCYILDGTLFISNFYEKTNPVVKTLKKNIMLGTPRPTTRMDERLATIKTIARINGAELDPLAKERRRKKRKTVKRQTKSGDRVDYDAVDIIVAGVEFECMLQPDAQPDDIFHYPELGKKLYRAQSIRHHGDTSTFEDWTTDIDADFYSNDGGYVNEGLLEQPTREEQEEIASMTIAETREALAALDNGT